ncbi:MAG: sensor domain-containing phosphodiesterase, partial [Mesorhizobium sp.]
MTNFLRNGSLFAFVLATLLTLWAASSAFAVEPIKIARDDVALDLSGAVEIYRNQGENFQVSTAPGPDGIVRRIEVEANDARSTGDWAVFALAGTFVVFLFAYLNLNRWHGHFSYGALVWILGLVLIAGVAIVDPAVAAGIARLSFAATALTGLGLIIF